MFSANPNRVGITKEILDWEREVQNNKWRYIMLPNFNYEKFTNQHWNVLVGVLKKLEISTIDISALANLPARIVARFLFNVKLTDIKNLRINVEKDYVSLIGFDENGKSKPALTIRSNNSSHLFACLNELSNIDFISSTNCDLNHSFFSNFKNIPEDSPLTKALASLTENKKVECTLVASCHDNSQFKEIKNSLSQKRWEKIGISFSNYQLSFNKNFLLSSPVDEIDTGEIKDPTWNFFINFIKTNQIKTLDLRFCNLGNLFLNVPKRMSELANAIKGAGVETLILYNNDLDLVTTNQLTDFVKNTGVSKVDLNWNRLLPEVREACNEVTMLFSDNSTPAQITSKILNWGKQFKNKTLCNITLPNFNYEMFTNEHWNALADILHEVNVLSIDISALANLPAEKVARFIININFIDIKDLRIDVENDCIYLNGFDKNGEYKSSLTIISDNTSHLLSCLNELANIESISTIDCAFTSSFFSNLKNISDDAQTITSLMKNEKVTCTLEATCYPHSDFNEMNDRLSQERWKKMGISFSNYKLTFHTFITAPLGPVDKIEDPAWNLFINFIKSNKINTLNLDSSKIGKVLVNVPERLSELANAIKGAGVETLNLDYTELNLLPTKQLTHFIKLSGVHAVTLTHNKLTPEVMQICNQIAEKNRIEKSNHVAQSIWNGSQPKRTINPDNNNISPPQLS